MRLEQIPPDQLDDLVDDLADIRHDLGKYIGFESRMTEDLDALRRALLRDVHRTRDHDGRTESCFELWTRLRPAALDDDPDVVEIDDKLQAIATIDLVHCEPDQLLRARELVRDVTETTKRLHVRALALRSPTQA